MDTLDAEKSMQYQQKVREMDLLDQKKKQLMQSIKNKYDTKRRERSCLFFFKLETAIIIFTILDFLFIWLLLLMAQYSYGNEWDEDVPEQKAVKPKTEDKGVGSDTIDGKYLFLQEDITYMAATRDPHLPREAQYLYLFEAITDWFLIVLFMVKLYYGI